MEENGEFAQYTLQRTVQLNKLSGDESSNSLSTDEGRHKLAATLIESMPDDPYFIEVPAPLHTVMHAQLVCKRFQKIISDHSSTCEQGCVCSNGKTGQGQGRSHAFTAHSHREQSAEDNKTHVRSMRDVGRTNSRTSSHQEQQRHDDDIWDIATPRSERPRGHPAQRSYARPDPSMLFDC